MKVVDFFSGIGGMTRGLLDSGMDVVAGYDLNERCRDTYEHNNSGVKFINSDIRSISPKMLRRDCRLSRFDNVLFSGCAPCQPFSQLRRNGGQHGDTTLLAEFGRMVESLLPGYVLIENVPGIAKVRGFSTFQRFLRMLSVNGYDYSYDVLNAKHYGVSQNRQRLVLLASRNGKPTLPPVRYGTSLRPFKTVRQAISRFPAIVAGERHPTVPNHVTSALTALNLKRLRNTPSDGGGRKAWPDSLKLKCHNGGHDGHSDVYGRMFWDKPSPTLTGRCWSISNGRYGHPEQDRAISLREAASIQSFPDQYEFFGLNTHIAMQIGNAVPVRFAEQLGKHILRLRNNR